MNRILRRWICLPALAAAMAGGCGGGDAPDGDEVTTLERSQTLYVGGWDWSAPSTFNPLAGDPNFPVDGNVKLLYESLFGYNQMSGELEPMLATHYTQQPDRFVVFLDPRARFSNGEELSAHDVVYTFNLDKKYPTPRHSNWNFLSEVTALDSHTVTFVLQPDNPNPLVVLDMLSEVSILPSSVFSEVEANAQGDFTKILSFSNDQGPIGSGPYLLHSFSDRKIILKRNDSYWGNVRYGNRLPSPVYIVHSLYNGNSHFNAAMSKGYLDLSSIFMPRIWEKHKDGIRAWSTKEPYHVPGSIPTLFMALTTEPFNDPAFRRACAHAVNFEKIKRLAVSRYTPDMQPGFILPFGPESRYYSAQDAQKYGARYSIDSARTILKDAGYSWNAAGQLVLPSGTVLRSLTLECPQGWTDWENSLKIVEEGFDSLGLDARQKFVDYGVWDQNVKKGTFDFIMKTLTADLWPSTPWKRFDQALSTRNLLAVGENMHNNFGRYSNPAASALLEAIPSMTSESELTDAYRALNRLFMQDNPVLPLMYRPTAFYQFSTKYWTNFPTEENPYAPPQCLITGAAIRALWELKPTGKSS